KPPEVDFVRRATKQARVWSVRVVPADDRVEPASHRLATEWNRDSPGRFLQTSNGSLNDRNAAVFPDGPEPGLDPVCPAPLLVTSGRPELRSFVADQVFGSCACSMDRPSQEGLNLNRPRLVSKDCRSHDPPRIVVEHESQPPA